MMSPHLLSAIATIGPVGFLRPAPGTWGSLAGVVSGVALITLAPFALELAIILLAIIGTRAANAYQQQTGKKDASEVVVDEVVGQWIPLLIIPMTPVWILAAFVLFRFFDITKLGPIGMAEKWPGGFGVMADDVVAGAAAAIILIVVQIGLGVW